MHSVVGGPFGFPSYIETSCLEGFARHLGAVSRDIVCYMNSDSIRDEKPQSALNTTPAVHGRRLTRRYAHER